MEPFPEAVRIALTFGHRTSRDLDFFVPSEFDSERLAEEHTKLSGRPSR